MAPVWVRHTRNTLHKNNVLYIIQTANI